MNGLRKPRQARWPQCADTISTAILRATRLTNAEMATVLEPLHDAHRALRAGVATEWQWSQFASAVNVALSICQHRVVRDIDGHLRSAELALQAIEQRATLCRTWQPVPLTFDELDALDAAVMLHVYQLSQLSAGEFHAAVKTTIGHITSSRGRMLNINSLSNKDHSHATH